ncbi:MAG TPA: RNA-binding S4 domain-containing protein [Pararobbsia sp.]|nr:RNA-binding S4 domain-containing protein [Pararobbsia sp.]
MQYKISTEPGARLRVDKWLWAARFFKTRSLAADAVGKGRVLVNGDAVKTSKELRVGDLVTIEIERLRWEVEVLGICDVRGPASIAQTLYAETSDSAKARATELERRKTFHEPATERHGRPTKRERRDMDRFSGGE